MKLYQCQNCGNPVFFENTSCEQCGFFLGYAPRTDTMLASKDCKDFRDALSQVSLVSCKNRQHKVCNWLVDSKEEGDFCEACQLNHTIPNLGHKKNLKRWRKIEAAKHRLIYSLNRLNLPLNFSSETGAIALKFDFLAPQEIKGKITPVMTGHLNGLITLSLEEASPVHREAMKAKMKERYRTLLGHFRHEVGHFYWEVLIKPNSNLLSDFTELFGDANQDYAVALQRHYENGPPNNWRDNFITKYASSHPWEDWAETWAHYLHIVDTLETAYSFGVKIAPKLNNINHMTTHIQSDPYAMINFNEIIAQYIPLAYGLNSMNRSMGKPDIYPFVLTTVAIHKLAFVHCAIHPGEV